MKNLFIIFLFLNSSYLIVAQQTISDWQHLKDYSSNPKKFVKAGKNVYFTATDPTHGRELWVTEGTSASIKLVKDIMIGENSSLLVGSVSDYTLATYNYLSNYSVNENGKLYFVASDNPNEVPKIWETDGTEIGTKKLRNEVKGQLHFTGEELIEYVFKQEESKLYIYYQDAKKDTIIALKPNPTIFNRTIIIRGDFLFLIGDKTAKRDVSKEAIIVDLKKRIIVGQISSFYYYGDLTFSEIWNNEIYFTKSGTNSQTKKYASELWRFNVNTSKQDSLLSFDDGKVSMMATPKEFFIFFRNDGTYSIKNSGGTPFKNETMNGFYATYYQHDQSDDVLYAYESNYGVTMKGVRLSDKKIVKNLSFMNTYISKIISPTKVIIYVENKSQFFDVKQEKTIPLTYSIDYQELFIDQEKSLTFLSSYSLKDSPRDAKLYVFDHKKEDFALLKNINIDGIKKPQIYTATFSDKLITVYNHEKGIMLSVSDGTKQGTKDLRLLVPRNTNGYLKPVNFIENNEKLGIVFQAANGSDSVYCFALDKKLIDCVLLYKKRKTEYSMNEMPIGLTSFLPITKGWYQINAFDSDYAVTDLTPKNTIVFKQKSYLIHAQSNYMVLAEFNIQTSERYLKRYDFQSKKYDTLSNSRNYVSTKIFEDRLYYRSSITNMWYITTDNGITALPYLKDINKIVKHKNEIYFTTYENPNQSSQGIRKSLFYVYRLNNSRPQIVVSDSIFSRYGINDYELNFSEFSIKGKKYLLTGGVFNEISNVRLFKIYIANNDRSLQKVSEFTLPLYGKWFEILKDGIIFRETTDTRTVVSIMQEDFSIKEVFQLAVNEYLITPQYPKMNVKRFYYSTLGNIYVTDGSLGGSKKLAVGIPVNPKIIYSSSFSYQFVFDSEETNFYFSISATSLWETDGTEKGTVQLTNDSSSKSYNLNNPDLALGIIGNTFFFKKPNFITGNYEVWTTEGSVETTKKLLDSKGNTIANPINNYAAWNNPFKKVGNKLYFNRQTPETGFEPWQTNGTPEGTKILGDLVKGFQSSDPSQFVEINQNPYCIATETNKALQLWAFCDLKASILAENNLPLNLEKVKLISTESSTWKYNWLKNGKTIERADLPTYDVSSTGAYRVKIEDQIGCVNVSDSVVINFADQISNSEDFVIRIFPNPTQNDLNLTFESNYQANFEVNLYDISGRLVIQRKVIPNQNNVLKMQEFNAGIYFLRLSDGEKQSVRKIVKE